MHRTDYYIVDREALPEVYIQVVEAKRLLASGKAATVHDAVEATGISRSSFYKYKDMIEPFTDMARKKTISIAAQLEDLPGVLPRFLSILESAGINILTIHQGIPINGLADTSLSMEMLEEAWQIDDVIRALKEVEGVQNIQILARE